MVLRAQPDPGASRDRPARSRRIREVTCHARSHRYLVRLRLATGFLARVLRHRRPTRWGRYPSWPCRRSYGGRAAIVLAGLGDAVALHLLRRHPRGGWPGRCPQPAGQRGRRRSSCSWGSFGFSSGVAGVCIMRGEFARATRLASARAGGSMPALYSRTSTSPYEPEGLDLEVPARWRSAGQGGDGRDGHQPRRGGLARRGPARRL